MSEIADLHFVQFVKFNRGLNLYNSLKGNRRTEQSRLLVFYGPTGGGKSYGVASMAGSKYWVSPPNVFGGALWMDGYNRDDIIVIDEFDGYISQSIMKRLVDFNPFGMQTKGGDVSCVSKLIVILSNFPPDNWWKRKGLEPAMIRRMCDPIGKVIYVGNTDFPTEESYRLHLTLTNGLADCVPFWMAPEAPAVAARLENTIIFGTFEESGHVIDLEDNLPVHVPGVADIPDFA